jgi:hypothetical protein
MEYYTCCLWAPQPRSPVGSVSLAPNSEEITSALKLAAGGVEMTEQGEGALPGT